MGVEWAAALVIPVAGLCGWLAYLYLKTQVALFEKQAKDTTAYFEKEARQTREWMTALTENMLSTTERILSPPAAPVDDEPAETDFGRVVFSRRKDNEVEEEE